MQQNCLYTVQPKQSTNLKTNSRKNWILVCIGLFLALGSFAQSKEVGKIISPTGSPIEGAFIVNLSKHLQTYSDSLGSFSINASEGDSLKISHVGFNDYTFLGNGNGSVKTVSLIASTKSSLEDVVVVGFGTQKKTNLTNPVGVISKEVLENRPNRNVLQSLQGVLPGLNIRQNTGQLNSNPTVNIRGTGSISSSSSASPLILIDGMEGDINALNPQDVESISVLKDASASAIYGTRAAFGVILVTTKKGKKGKIQVNYNNNIRSTVPMTLPKMMNAYQFALYFNDASTNGGNSAFFSDDRLQRIQDYMNGTLKEDVEINPNNTSYWGDGYAYGNANVDWYKAIYKSHSISNEHNLSLTGGNEKTQYYLSANYMHQNGQMVFNPDFLNRYTISAKITSELSSILNLTYSSRIIRTEFQRPSSLTDGLFNDLARQGWPVLPLYDPNGYLFSSPSPALGLRDGGKDRTTDDWIYQQLQLVLEPIKGWKTYAELNYRTNYNFRHWDQLQTYNHDISGQPYLVGTSSNVYEYGKRNNFFNSNIYSTLNRTVAQKHHFTGTIGFQTELNGYNDLSVQRVGIIDADVPTINTTNGISYSGDVVSPSITGQYQKWTTAGFFGRLNYDFDGKYLLEGDLRYDGSSRFRSDNRWGWFPSISAGWILSRENFWKNSGIKNIINFFKIRASYGTLGNQATDDWYPTYQTIPLGTANGSWLIDGKQPNTASNPSLISPTLTWETVKSHDIGVDFAMLNNKLNVTFDYYNRKTLNMVGPASELPAILGTTVPPSNNTDLKTRGWELQINWKDRLESGLGYGVTFSMSDYLTFVTKYPNPTGSLSTYRADGKAAIGQIWGYETIGIAKTQAEMDAHLATLSNGQNAFGSNWGAGDIMYADLNGDGLLNNGNNTISNHGDLKIIGNTSPRYNMSLNLNLDYKGIDFSAFFQGILKRQVYNNSYLFWGATNDIWWSTGLVQHLDYFRDDPNSPLGENLNAYYPRPVFGSSKNRQTQSKYVLNAAYMRLKNVQLGYTLPAAYVNKIGLSKIRIYISGENVFTITKMPKMFDPETVDYATGFYNGATYPMTKIYSAGLSVTF